MGDANADRAQLTGSQLCCARHNHLCIGNCRNELRNVVIHQRNLRSSNWHARAQFLPLFDSSCLPDSQQLVWYFPRDLHLAHLEIGRKRRLDRVLPSLRDSLCQLCHALGPVYRTSAPNFNTDGHLFSLASDYHRS